MKIQQLSLIVGLTLMSGSFAFAQTVTSTSTTFGPLPGATFDGTGDPTDPVEVTTINTTETPIGIAALPPVNNTITLGLAAQQRYFNPPLTTGPTAVYHAAPGANYGDPSNPAGPGPSAFIGSTWNVDFYVNVANGFPGDYTFDLLYSPTANAPATGDLDLNIYSFFIGSTTSTTFQDSENLDFAFLDPAFDPNATGAYDFVLQASDANGVIGDSAITVDVGNVPDNGSTAGLLALGVAGLFLVRFGQGRSFLAK